MNKRNLLILGALLVAAAVGFFYYTNVEDAGAPGQAPLTVSVNLPLTGPIANSGKLFQDAVTLALEDIAKDASAGRVSFDWNDNAATPARAATVAQRQAIFDAGIFFVGYSAETLAVQPVLAATGKPTFTFSFLATITKDPLIYRNSISYKIEYPLLVDYAKQRQAKKIAVIHLDLPEAHEEFKQFVIPELVQAGLRESDFSLFPYAVTETEFRTVAARVAQIAPDLIMINGFQSTLAPIVQSLRSLGLVKDGNVIGTFDTLDIVRLIGNEAVEGIVVATPTYLVRPSARAADFQARYQARFGQPPSYSGFTGYDMVLIAADLSRRVPPNPTPQQLNDELKKTDTEGLSAQLKFDEDGDVIVPVETAVFRGGKLVPVAVR